MKFLSYPVFNWSNLTIHPYKIQFTNIKDKKNQLFLGYLDKLQTQRRTAIISFFSLFNFKNLSLQHQGTLQYAE